MILFYIGILILLLTTSWFLYQIIPEVKKFLLKERQINHINNIHMPAQQITQQQEKQKEDEKEEKKQMTVEEKMQSTFLSPKLKDIKTNFNDIGEVKKSKKNIDDEVKKIKDLK